MLPDGAVSFFELPSSDVGYVAPGFGSHRAGTLTWRSHQLGAIESFAAFVLDVGFVFVAEKTQRGQHWVRRSLSQTAQRR